MIKSLFNIAKRGILTSQDVCPELPEQASGLPQITPTPCRGTNCQQCALSCPMQAITVADDEQGGMISLDRGRCIGCQLCISACQTGTITPDRSTQIAVRTRHELIMTNREQLMENTIPSTLPFLRSLHVREVATGDSASDLEVIASTNAIFDIARFGIHFVASPRYADALLVTGPVGRAMQEPLRRCYDAMAEPRIVIAAGVAAICGGLFSDGYSEANGVNNILPVSCYIPGDPPHPWSIIHGLLIVMGKI